MAKTDIDLYFDENILEDNLLQLSNFKYKDDGCVQTIHPIYKRKDGTTYTDFSQEMIGLTLSVEYFS